jgi:hypothetical protein
MSVFTKTGLIIGAAITTVGATIGYLAYKHFSIIDDLKKRAANHALKIHLQLLNDGVYLMTTDMDRISQLWVLFEPGLQEIIEGYPDTIREYVYDYARYDLQRVVQIKK